VSWSLYRWTWCLESPLYVGMPPAGSVNRCRLYVPARAVWGAVTAEIARAKALSGFPEYNQVGNKLSCHARFAYLFPAEQVGEDWGAWLPRYVPNEGLVWQREGAANEQLPDRRFQMRLLSTRPSTAIEPSSDAAAEGSLRETECINTCWRDQGGRRGGPVGLVGYVFIHKDLHHELRTSLEQLNAIMVGGDTRYGLGQLRRWNGMVDARAVFGCNVDLGQEDPLVQSERVLGHAASSSEVSSELCGEMELLRGWDYGSDKPWHVKDPLWVPGSCAQSPREWSIKDSGHWS
jgi:hypothetical protein